MSLKETAIKLTCVVLMLVCFALPVSADWYSDIKPNSTWVEIEGENFVADTFMGVKALYNEDNRNHQCGDLVIRFYKEAMGIDIYPYTSGGPTSETSGYKFVKTTSPKAGDIIYVSKEMRGSSQDHWAIVRDYSDGYITMFEQNVIWNGQAVVGRQIKYPSDSYYVYTLVATDGSQVPDVGEVETTTEVQTTKVPETTVTVTETTTVVTTTKPTTTAVSTTKAQTTAVLTTQAVTEPSTLEITEEVTEEYTTESVSEIDISQTELNTTDEAAKTTKETTTAENGEDENSKPNYVLPAIGACALLIAVATVVMMNAKKKRK